MSYWFFVLRKSQFLGTLTVLSILITVMGLLSPIFIIHIFNRYISFGLQGTLFFLISGAIFVAVFEFFFRNVRNKIFSEILVNPSKNLKLELISKYFSFSDKSNLTNKKFIDILDFSNNFFQFLSPKNQSSLFDSFFAILIIVVLFFLDIFLATIFVSLLVFFVLIQGRLINQKQKLIISNSISNYDKNIIKEFASNHYLLKFYNSFKYAGFNAEKYFDKKITLDSLISNIDAKQASFTNFFVIISSISIIGIGSVIVVNGNLTIGSLIGFNIFATRALGIISLTQNALNIIKKTDDYILSCNEYFKDLENRVDGLQLSKCNGLIEINNVDFSYANEKKFLLRNFSVSFSPSEISVIYGKNGCGKTTLAKLLVSFIKPNSGEILIDKTNFDKLSLVWLRDQMAYCPQQTEILNSTVIDNILISNPKLNELEVSRLLQTVDLDNELKNSNLSISGNLSPNLSIGILKKIQIARAIAKNTKICIFDDPLLSLDIEGKKMFLNLLTSLKRSGKTVICFSNDKDILEISDRKILLGEKND